jgi:hypothetical protein
MGLPPRVADYESEGLLDSLLPGSLIELRSLGEDGIELGLDKLCGSVSVSSSCSSSSKSLRSSSTVPPSVSIA